jgi:hypothetical protein
MSRLIRWYDLTLVEFRRRWPMLGALVAGQGEGIAASIPGLGPCRSTYCRPQRRVLH